ncbi:hypothetical protein LEP1GSC192_2169 [Leptospira sp. B5-022]|nr:hypothetical protein LEP1GSC192_2169 [Leptospira sp. B5-022]
MTYIRFLFGPILGFSEIRGVQIEPLYEINFTERFFILCPFS